MSTAGPEPRLILGEAGDQREFVLEGDHVLIGRAAACDVVLSHETVSRSHARVERQGSGFVVEDLGSPNGTFVNGMRVERKTLSPGDTIVVGKSTMRFASAAEAKPDVTSIATEAELDTVMSEETVSVRLHNTTAPMFVAHVAGQTWEVPLSGDALAIGRDPKNDIVFGTPTASRRHARIERRGDAVVIRDLDTNNGTWVNGERVTERELTDGAIIRVGDARLVFKTGVASAEQTLVDLTNTDGARLSPVVFVPGFMGSELWRGSERIWPNFKTLFVNPELLALNERNVLEPRRIVHEVVIVPNLVKLDKYIRLGNYLEEGLGYERGKNLLEFPYDWRQDNRISARQLGAAIEEWQQRSRDAQGPITIIAHSNGSLVSRYYIDQLGGKAKVKRIIFLGGPHRGVPKAVSGIFFGPKVHPFGHVGERLQEAVCTFPSMYQLLPTYSCAVDQAGERINVLADEMWVSEHQRELLRDARKFRKELGSTTSVPSICIFGYGIETIMGLSVRRGGVRHWENVKLSVQPTGDDMVPEASAVLKGAEIHPVRQHHGALYTDSDVRKRLKVELMGGGR